MKSIQLPFKALTYIMMPVIVLISMTYSGCVEEVVWATAGGRGSVEAVFFGGWGVGVGAWGVGVGGWGLVAGGGGVK